jgi:hypothetical protein
MSAYARETSISQQRRDMRTYVKATKKQRKKMAEHGKAWSQFALYRAWKTTGKSMSKSQLKKWLAEQDKIKIPQKSSKRLIQPQQNPKSVVELRTKLFPFEAGKQTTPWVDQFGDLYEREDVERIFPEKIKVVRCQIDRASMQRSGESFIDVHMLSRKLRLERKAVVMTVVGVYPLVSNSQITIDCVKTETTDVTNEHFVLMSEGFRGELRPGFVPKYSYANDRFAIDVAYASRSNRASNIYSLTQIAHSIPLMYYFKKTMSKFDVSDNPLISFSFVPRTIVTDISIMYKPSGKERLTISVCRHGDKYDDDLLRVLCDVSDVKTKLVNQISNIKDEEEKVSEVKQLRAYSENSQMVDYSYMIGNQHENVLSHSDKMFYMVAGGKAATYTSGDRTDSGPITVSKCTIYDTDEAPTRYSVIVRLGTPSRKKKKKENVSKKINDDQAKKFEEIAKVEKAQNPTPKSMVINTSTPEVSDYESEFEDYTQEKVMKYVDLLSYAKQVVFLTA